MKRGVLFENINTFMSRVLQTITLATGHKQQTYFDVGVTNQEGAKPLFIKLRVEPFIGINKSTSGQCL